MTKRHLKREPRSGVTGRKLPCNVRVVAKQTKTCGSFRDLKLTHDIKTTTTLYTIQTDVIHDILVSSPITAVRGGGVSKVEKPENFGFIS